MSDNPTPASENPLASFYSWVISEHQRLYLLKRKLEARTRELYPTVARRSPTDPLYQSWAQMCAELYSAQFDHQFFDECYLVAAGAECLDFLPCELPEILFLWERYQSMNSAAISASS